MAKAIGIDIGSRACKVAVVDGGPKGARLVRFAEVEVAAGPGGAPTPETYEAALRKALSDARGPKQAAGYALAAEHLVVREITVPFENEDQIRKVVKFEFEPHLHNGAIEDVVLDYVNLGKTQIGPGKTGSKLLVFAAFKDVLRGKLERLREVGVDPLHVDTDVTALMNTAAQCGAFEAHPNCLVIDIGASTTKALAVRDGKLRVARSIRIGARGAEREVQNRLQGDADAAKRALEAAAGAESLAIPADGPSTVEIVSSVREIEAAVARAVQDDFLSRVLRETSRSLPSTGDTSPITCVYLTGGGSRHARARERIASHFGVEVKDLPTLARLSPDLPPSEAERVSASAAVAIGAALKVLGVDAVRVDLRQDEFRFARTFDRVKVPVAIAATLLFFAVFLHLLQNWIEFQQVKRESAEIRRVIQESLSDEVFERYRQKVPDARAALATTGEDSAFFKAAKLHTDGVRNHLKNELGLATDVPPIRSGLQTWSVVSKALQEERKNIEYLLVKSEKYLQTSADVTLVLLEAQQAERIVQRLRSQKGLVKSVETRMPKRTKDGSKEEVTIHIELEEPAHEGDDGTVADAAAQPGTAPAAAAPAGKPTAAKAPDPPVAAPPGGAK